MAKERLTVGEEMGVSPPLVHCSWGLGSGRGTGKRSLEGLWPKEAHGGPRDLASEPFGAALLLALADFPPSCPWALCPGPAISSCHLSQPLASTAMRSWGGVSWQVSPLHWSRGRCTAEPWARRLCNLPPGPLPFQGGSFSEQPALSGPPQSTDSNKSGTLACAMS